MIYHVVHTRDILEISQIPNGSMRKLSVTVKPGLNWMKPRSLVVQHP
jgi:hypothetical protein